MTKDAPKDLLLEIGVEELPARFISPALSALKVSAEKSLQEAGLSFTSAEVMGTPRRLALLVHGLSPKAKDLTQESLGPALAQAKDPQGNWTPAAQGFARSQGVAPEKLQVKDTDRGPRLAFTRHTPGRPAAQILPELLPGLIKKIPFAKNMVWEESRFSFARPVRWIAAMLDKAVVRFQLAGVKSGDKTFGLRVHGKKPLPIPSPARYAAMLKDRLVVVSGPERRALVEKQVQLAVKPAKGHVPTEKYPDLLDEVANLVEHPAGVLGGFDPKYLSLPPEVLVTSMKKHQKYFPVFGADGALMPHFVGVRNGISESQGVVREGFERVLSARLADAAFFHAQDGRSRLADKAPQLKGVLFQKALGSVWDKVERSVRLAGVLGEALGLPADVRSEAAEALRLGKADLVSAMVGEFPELQGVMGRIYAQAEGLPAGVAQAIEQHYWPLTAEGALPESPAAALAALADKLDTLAGDFLVGLVPTGSQDPYGLRRAAVGALRILDARGWALPLKAALEKALALFPESVQGDRAQALKVLSDFFRQRWSALREAEGARPDEVAAVTAAGFDDPLDASHRLAAVRAVRKDADFASLATAYKRASKIVKQAEKEVPLPADGRALPVREDLLADEAEKALFAVSLSLREAVEPLIHRREYGPAYKALLGFRAPVDLFFEKVMVMAPEADLRRNRVSLLANVVQLFRAVADLSQLQDAPAAR